MLLSVRLLRSSVSVTVLPPSLSNASSRKVCMRECTFTPSSLELAVCAPQNPTRPHNKQLSAHVSIADTLHSRSRSSDGARPSCMRDCVFASTLPLSLCPPPPMRTNFIDRRPSSAHVTEDHEAASFRQSVCASSDVSMRPLLRPAAVISLAGARARSAPVCAKQVPHTGLIQGTQDSLRQTQSYGERVRQLSCRWAAKFYGQVTFGPRNFPYPSSRWLARRFQMKKHRIIKRFRFRRYKLAAVANLPFAKMIRVGMLPELKSSKTRKADVVDAELASQLVGAARGSTGAKEKGKRTRPKSKYQV